MTATRKKLLSLDYLDAGDVLLCYKAKKIDPVGEKIREVTNSDYTHAAICVDPANAVEAVFSQGVRKVSIKVLVNRYDHVAVFRQPDAWTPDRTEALQAFTECVVTSGAKYNRSGVISFSERKVIHDLTVTEQLNAYFNEGTRPVSSLKEEYFCSELVADCFIATRFIDPSAAIVYQSSVMSPGDLGRDPTFGTFCGYVTTSPGYTVTAEDEFFNTPTLAEIFENDSDAD